MCNLHLYRTYPSTNMIYDIFLEIPASFIPKRVIKGCTLQLKLISIRNISYDMIHIFHLKDHFSPTIRGTFLYSLDLKIALVINISFVCINRWADNLSIRSFLTAEKFLIDITQGLICIKFII